MELYVNGVDDSAFCSFEEAISGAEQVGGNEKEPKNNNNSRTDMPVQGEGEEEGQPGRNGTQKAAPPKEPLRLVRQQIDRGSRGYEQTYRQNGAYRLQAGDKYENNQAEQGVIQNLSVDSQRGCDIGLEQVNKQRSLERGQGNDGQGADGERNPEIGVREPHEAAEEPVVYFLLKSHADQNEVTNGEGECVYDAQRTVLVHPGGSGDKKRPQPDD